MTKHPTDLLAYLRAGQPPKPDWRRSLRLCFAVGLLKTGDMLTRRAIQIAPELIQLEM